ncbi:MAG: MFS transporter [Acidaminococcales bacterium]|nr:MFS transporter [Acidaminococcales bacterium]
MKKSFLSLPLLLVAAGHLAVDLGQGALPVLLPFIRDLFGLSYTQVGIVVMVQNITSSVIQPLFGYMIDKVYWPPLLPVSIFIAAIAMSLTGYALSYGWLLVIIVFAGLGSACFHPQGAVAINSISDDDTRGKSMGLFSVGGNLGFALGSLFMAFLLTKLAGGLSGTIYFAIPSVTVALLLCLSLGKIPDIRKSNPGKGRACQKNATPYLLLAILLAVIFVRSTIHTSLQTYMPLYYINYLKEDPAYAGYLVALFLFGGACGTFIGASLSDRFGRKTIIVLSMAASMPLIAFFPHVSGLLCQLAVFLAGLALVSSFATTLVLAQEMMPANIGVASGLTVGFSVGLGGVGTTLLGAAADHFDLPAVLLILALMPIAGLVCALWLPGRMFVRR